MAGCGCEIEIRDARERHVLYWLLGINAFMFVAEIGIGWYADSTALIADSLDMLADAIVYGISLYAIGRSAHHKARAALLSGYFQLGLGLLVLAEVVRRALFGAEPISMLMMGMGAIALVANLICLRLIHAHREGEAHMRASWIFTANDVIANLGVIIAGALVMWLDSFWPDILIGTVIALVVLNGARRIIMDSRHALAQSDSTGCDASQACCTETASAGAQTGCCSSSSAETEDSNAVGCGSHEACGEKVSSSEK